MTSTSTSPAVTKLRAQMLAHTTRLRAVIQDPNALMAGNEILNQLQRLEELRTEYAAAAQVAHSSWCERNL